MTSDKDPRSGGAPPHGTAQRLRLCSPPPGHVTLAFSLMSSPLFATCSPLPTTSHAVPLPSSSYLTVTLPTARRPHAVFCAQASSLLQSLPSSERSLEPSFEPLRSRFFLGPRPLRQSRWDTHVFHPHVSILVASTVTVEEKTDDVSSPSRRVASPRSSCRKNAAAGIRSLDPATREWNHKLNGLRNARSFEHVEDAWEKMEGSEVPKDVVTYTSMINAAVKFRRYERAEELLRQAVARGLVDPFLITAAMSLFARTKNAGAAQAFWEEVQAAKMKPGTIAWAAYLNAVKEGADFEAVEGVWRSMVRRQVHKSVSAYTCMIGAAVKFGHYDRAQKLLQDMHKKGIAPNAYTATVVLDLHAKRGDAHAARAFWDFLAGVEPKIDLGVHQWTSYLNSLTSRPALPPSSDSDSDPDSDFATAERVWGEMVAAGVEPNVATYTVMIGAAVRHGRHDAARRVLDEMRSRGVAPTPMAATAVLQLFAKTGDVPSACEYIEEMDRHGVSLGPIPWTVYLATVADTYASTDFTPVRQCWQEMRRRGVEPTPSLYAVMVGAALRAEELDEAERLFDEMARRNVPVNAALVTHRLSLFSRRHDLSGARAYWASILARSESESGSESDSEPPGTLHWNAYLSVLADGGDFDHVEECWGEMERRGVGRDASSYSCMIGACCRFDRLDVAERLLRAVRRSPKKIGMSGTLVSSAMRFYAKKRDSAGAGKLWNEARKAGIELGVIAWTAYLGALAESVAVTTKTVSAGSGFEHVWATWADMGKAGIEPNATTYAVVMSAALKHQLPHRCVELNEQMKERGVGLTPATLHLMLQAYAKLREPEQARLLWEEAVQVNVQMNPAHSAAYLAALAEGDDYDAVEGVWKRLDRGEGGVDKVQKTPAAYCAMISAAVKARRMDLVDTLLAEMKERGVAPDEAMAKETVAAYARRGADVVGTLWEVLKASGVGMDADDWAGHIVALGRWGEEFSAVEARWRELEGKRVKKNGALYGAMISACVKFERWDRANALVGEMRANGVEPDPNTVTTILTLYGRTGDVDTARRFWKALQDGGTTLSVVHWTSYLNALAEGGEFEAVEGVWTDMDSAGVAKNVATYTAMLGAAVKAQQWGRALEVFGEMRKKQVAPVARTVTTLLNMYAKTHDVEAAKALWKEVSEAQVQLGVIPWTAYLTSLAEGEEFDPVWALWTEMDVKGVAKNVATYTAMMQAAIKYGRLSVADALIREMNKNKIPPNALTITTILGLYRRRKDTEGARRFWNELDRPNLLQVEKNSKVHLGTIHWTAYLNTLAEGKDFALVEECWRDMGLRRVEKNVATYTAMIGAAVKFKQLQRAEELLDEMVRLNVQMNPATLTNVLNLYGKLKDVDSARRFWDGIRAERAQGDVNVNVNVVTWTAYLNAVSSDKGHFHLAEEIWKEMDENGIAKNVATYTAMIAAAIRCNRLPRAEELVKEMRERGIEPDAMAARTVLGMYAKTKDAEAARMFWNDMSDAKLKPDALHWSAYLTAVSGQS